VNTLFGTSGIRGSAKDFLTNQFCFDIGRAFGIFLKNHKQKVKIAVGMDPRKSSSRIKKAFSLGLLKEGCKASDQGIAPAPAMNYILIADPTFIGSCMITGSHIRSDFNGLKFFAFKEEILKKQEKEIENIYQKIKEKIPFKLERVEVEKGKEAIKFYQEMLLNLVKSPYPKWKVVIDAGNGCQLKVMPELFKRLGLKVKIINGSLQPEKFIARDTETEEAAKELQEKVKKERADFGIAFDGDGDRVVFVDEKGRFIPGDYIGTLIAKYSPTATVIIPTNTSQVVETIGKKVVRTKVGSPYVVEAMKKYKATFGFEANGGGISAEIMMSRDAGSVTIKILNLLAQSKKTLGELINTLPQFFLYRTKVNCPQELNSIILKEAKKKFKGVKTEEIDGLKLWTTNSSWILFRPSSNAPEFRVFAEAKTKEEAKKLGQAGIGFVKSLVK
jgi:phosphomannomutase/phosphoglucomutase